MDRGRPREPYWRSGTLKRSQGIFFLRRDWRGTKLFSPPCANKKIFKKDLIKGVAGKIDSQKSSSLPEKTSILTRLPILWGLALTRVKPALLLDPYRQVMQTRSTRPFCPWGHLGPLGPLCGRIGG